MTFPARASTPPVEPQFVSRYEVAKLLGRSQMTVARIERAEGLAVIRLNGHVLYTRESVDAVMNRWKARADREAGNRKTIIPRGWHLWIANARGPFIGEFIPISRALSESLDPAPDLQTLPTVDRARRCIVSYTQIAEAFRVADAEGLNIISNGRGIVAVKEGEAHAS